MRTHKGSVLLILVALTLAAAEFRTQVPSGPARGSQENRRREKQEEHLRKYPIADYESAEPSDPETRAQRRAKSKTYNSRGESRRVDPREPVVGALHNDWEWGLDSTLPVSQSSAVIIGRVTGARAYLSEDKANVYSEFTVQVEEVLADDRREPIRAGDLIAVERMGGRVRFPSGQVSSFYVSGQNPPQTGSRYVLFLGYNRKEAGVRSVTSPPEMSRHLLTGYELRDGRVSPLDAAGGINFKAHEGKDEAAFRSELGRLIADSSQSSPK